MLQVDATASRVQSRAIERVHVCIRICLTHSLVYLFVNMLTRVLFASILVAWHSTIYVCIYIYIYVCVCERVRGCVCVCVVYVHPLVGKWDWGTAILVMVGVCARYTPESTSEFASPSREEKKLRGPERLV